MTQPASFVDDGSFRGYPVCVHLPPHFLEYTYIVSTLSTFTSKITHSRQGPAPKESDRQLVYRKFLIIENTVCHVCVPV
jgi:hypothetical protein